MPVLTCAGNSYAARVSASLLQTLGLPELIADSLENYEAMGLKLAREPELLAGIKARLAHNRDALFDSARFTRELERAYQSMWTRRKDGLAPASFDVARD